MAKTCAAHTMSSLRGHISARTVDEMSERHHLWVKSWDDMRCHTAHDGRGRDPVAKCESLTGNARFLRSTQLLHGMDILRGEDMNLNGEANPQTKICEWQS